MGHRIANHRSVCKGLHGHRYKAEICLTGDLVNIEGISEEGMVMDFSDIKKIALSEVLHKLDHSFMIHDQDQEMIDFFNFSKGHKPIITSFIPTAENVAKYIFKLVDKKISDKYDTGLQLYSIKLWETPTSYAKFIRDDLI